MKKVERQILAVSHLDEDLRFAEAVAERLQGKAMRLTDRTLVMRLLNDQRNSLVFWNADDIGAYGGIFETPWTGVFRKNIFALTEKPLRECPHLFKQQIFRHHFLRKYDETAVALCAAIGKATERADIPALKSFFPAGTPIKKIAIKDPTHKRPAIDAIYNYLSQQNLSQRIAASAVQALDELMLNALFDAPIDPSGNRYRASQSRAEAFEMSPQESVELELASSDEVVGACIVDHFGSIKSEMLLNALGRHFRRAVIAQSSTSPLETGLGLRGILNSGLSLLVATTPNVETRAMIFFRRTQSFVEFRKSFQFTSLFTD